MLPVPHIAEQNGKEMRSCDLFSRLLQDRIIIMADEVSDDMATVVCSELLYLDAQDPRKDIYLYINSPGGSVTAGLAIYDTMQFVSAPVATCCYGCACSMGALLLAAGAPGRRFSLPHAQILIHQPSMGVHGMTTDIQIHARQAQYVKDLLAGIMASHSGQSVEDIARNTERDMFLTANEAMGMGLIDKVISCKQDVRGPKRAKLKKRMAA